MCELSDKKINSLKNNIPVAVGDCIKHFRLQKKITQVELAKRTQKDRQYIYKIEKGIVTPNITTIAILAVALDISLKELFETL